MNITKVQVVVDVDDDRFNQIDIERRVDAIIEAVQHAQAYAEQFLGFKATPARDHRGKAHTFYRSGDRNVCRVTLDTVLATDDTDVCGLQHR